MEVEIIEFEDKYKQDFKYLNYEWIEKSFIIEPADLYILTNPAEAIIDNGGFIFFAQVDNKIAGTYALIKVDDETYEIAKMAVTENYQNLGIGKKLMESALQHAKQIKAKKLVLYSHTRLKVALKMYAKFGFNTVTIDNHPTKRANIKMELILNTEN